MNCRDRRDAFWPNAGQWTVWLTREQHDGFKALLAALDPKADGITDDTAAIQGGHRWFKEGERPDPKAEQ